MKKIEITIISAILLLLAFCFGCKNKVEPIKPKYQPIYNRALTATEIAEIEQKLSEPNELFETKEIWLSIELEGKPTFEDSNRFYLYEGDEFDIVIEKNEPNEPEPNEPQLVIDIPEHRWKCSCGEKHYELFCLTCSCGKKYKTFEIFMNNIPTWPEYIELGKDLVLRYDFPEPNNPLLIHIPSEFRIISKGTKIFFKEDE